MVALEKMAILTFLMAVLVVLTTVLTYQNSAQQGATGRFVDLLSTGLTFFFIAYAAAIVYETRGNRGSGLLKSMYVGIAVITSVTAWLLWILNGTFTDLSLGGDNLALDSAGSTPWMRVSTQVARPLALGSLFVLPYLYVTMF